MAGSASCSTRLEKGANAAADVPEREHFNLATADTIVKVVMNSREMHALLPLSLGHSMRVRQCRVPHSEAKTPPRVLRPKLPEQEGDSVPPKRSAINVPL